MYVHVIHPTRLPQPSQTQYLVLYFVCIHIMTMGTEAKRPIFCAFGEAPSPAGGARLTASFAETAVYRG